MDFKNLLTMMVQKKASDLFITAGRAPTAKINGIMVEVSNKIITAEQAAAIITGIMDVRQKEELKKMKECQFALGMQNLGRFRVNVFTQRDALGMVVHRLEYKVPDAEELQLPPLLKSLVMKRRGLLLFVGDPDTGKSSSVAALIKHRNENGKGHIITIEDPMKFQHAHAGCIISQREVGIDTESYQVALKNILRQAPDVIFIGEIKNREMMQDAINFSATRLCLSVLYASTVSQAMERILHFFPQELRGQLLLDLSLNLQAIVAHKLINRAYDPGRYLALEILVNTPAARTSIRRGDLDAIKELMANSRSDGMQTFDQALCDLHLADKISYDDAVALAESKNEIRLMIKRNIENREIFGDEGVL